MFVDDHLERFVTETQRKYLYLMIWSENSNNETHHLLGYKYAYLECSKQFNPFNLYGSTICLLKGNANLTEKGKRWYELRVIIIT